jgi:glycine/D-amino acid oxidase-like deaminating enzyme
MTRYGRSPWIDNCPKSLVPSFPRQRDALTTDVVIVGGGLTGCATAYAFAAAGIKAVVVEAAQIGRGSSGFASGWISDDPGVSFQAVETAIGLRSARRGWRAWRRASLDFIALVRRLNLRCSFEQHGALLVASTPEQLVRLRKEQKVRREAGLDAPVVNARAVGHEAAITAMAAIRTHDGATLDPYRATIGLAHAAVERGAAIFEHSPATKVSFSRKWVDVKTASGSVRADTVVLATGTPTALFKTLARHFWYRSSFLTITERVPAKIRQQLGERRAVVRDSAAPPHVLRWVNDEQLLITGADIESVAPPLREKTIVQRTGQLMYELSTIYPDISGLMPEYGWEASYGRTADGLPYVGPHRNYPRHLFAFGDASHSVTGAYLASRILLRHFQGEPETSDEVFGFLRLPRSG